MNLYTYSASTAVRAALLWAGFWVAEGVGTGPKATTTIASTLPNVDRAGIGMESRSESWLGEEWLARWRRSDSRYPADLDEAERAAFCRRIEAHRQFAARVVDP